MFLPFFPYSNAHAVFRFTLVCWNFRYCLERSCYSCIHHCNGSFDINNQSVSLSILINSLSFFTYSKVLGCFLIHPPPPLLDGDAAEVYATARTWWLHGGRPGCPLSCRVHGLARCGSASLWNINMTRNIISHDSRRRGNTKYYPAEAPVGWPAGLLLPPRGSCILLLAAARRTCSGHETR